MGVVNTSHHVGANELIRDKRKELHRDLALATWPFAHRS
jgi:hypothetical protein